MYRTFCAIPYESKTTYEKGHAKNVVQIDIQMNLAFIFRVYKEL